MNAKDDYIKGLRERQEEWEEEKVIIAVQTPAPKPKVKQVSVWITIDVMNWLDDKVDRGEFVSRSEAIRFYLKTARDTD
jgi:hypothetical protein